MKWRLIAGVAVLMLSVNVNAQKTQKPAVPSAAATALPGVGGFPSPTPKASRVSTPAVSTPASEEQSEDIQVHAPSSSQHDHGPFGFNFTILGDPGINVFGLNFLYGFTEDWRAHVGFGTLFDFGWTVGGGVDYFVPTGTRWRPLFGIRFQRASSELHNV